MSNLPAEIPEESLEVLGGYSPQMLAARLQNMKQALSLLQDFFKQVMVQGQDYGVIPGTKKPSLYKSGAEKLCELYDYAITVKHVEETADRQTGFYRAKVTVALVQRRTGLVVAEGVGEANTMEGRYRWRWLTERQLPKGIDKSTLPSEEKTTKNGGKYTVYRVENDDPYTLWNTVLKMSKKRASIDATLSATRSSGILTQDLEDLREWIGGGAPIVDAEFVPVDEESKNNGKPLVEGTSPANQPAQTPTEFRMPYGKDKDKPISQATTDNLLWMHNTLDEAKLADPRWGERNRRLKAALAAELNAREGREDDLGEPADEGAQREANPLFSGESRRGDS